MIKYWLFPPFSKVGLSNSSTGLTRSLAWEVGRFNIRANVIQPGYIQTDMTKGAISLRPFFPPLLSLKITPSRCFPLCTMQLC